MSSFPFLPRSIGRPKKTFHESHNSHACLDRRAPENVPGPSVLSATTSSKPLAVETQTRRTASHNDDELLAMLELSLSDYALWCTPELQYQMKLPGQDGYIPMKYILNNFFPPTETTISEVALMQCLRFSPNTILEARMLITEPSRNDWHNQGHSRFVSSTDNSHTGGFEVRRKDWECVLHNLENGKWTKEWWDRRTVYVERLPAAFRSIPAVARYINSLLTLANEGVSDSSSNLVQSVTFPSHHLASPREPSRCKGFAFVVFDSPEQTAILSRDYPWPSVSSRPDLDQDAVKFGLGVLSYESWNVLKAEYLSYQQRLLSDAAEMAAASELPAAQIQSQETSIPPEMEQRSSWYPQDCLVFVRNIHPGTNKTTLRNLFQDALSTSRICVDYVDFSKGIDTCHLRLGSPSDATQLMSHFESQPISQCDPLDQVGSKATEERSRIKIEVVQGKREELYWEKVPEKLRNAALERLAGRMNSRAVEAETQGGRVKKRRQKV